MAEEQKYRKVIPYGTLTVGDEMYLLLSPEPVVPPNAWEDGLHRHGLRYLVVPADGQYKSKLHKTTYLCARHIVIFGDHYIEYTINSVPILVNDIGEGDLLGEAQDG